MPSSKAKRAKTQVLTTDLRGVSLVEVMVATGLLSLAILFSMGLLPSFKMSNRRANMELQAGALAQSALEEYRAAPFEALASNTTTITKDDLTFVQETVVTDSASGLAKTVRVNLSWEWKNKTLRTFRQTVLSKVPRA